MKTQPDRPSSALIRDELAGASAGTIARIPKRENRKQVCVVHETKM